MKKQTHKNKRAVGIVINNRNILLMWRMKNNREFFVFPGGGVEPGESVQDAVVRELQEETTIEVTIDRLLYHHHYIEYDARYSDQYYYLCQYVSGTPQLAAESEELQEMKDDKTNKYEPRWVKISDLPRTLVFPLEIRDWLIHDVMHGFKNRVQYEHMHVKDLRQRI